MIHVNANFLTALHTFRMNAANKFGPEDGDAYFAELAKLIGGSAEEQAARCRRLAAAINNNEDPTRKALLALAAQFDRAAAERRESSEPSKN